MSCYLVSEGQAATLIDTGYADAEGDVVEQLRIALPQGAGLTVFLTRAEYEGIGNVGAVHAAVGIEHLIAGGIANIFDGYAEVAGFTRRWDERTFVDRVPPGQSLPVGSSRRLEVLSAPLRILATFWVFDRVSKTLFTSDAFGHTSLASREGSVVIDSVESDASTYESVREHMLAKFAWLAHGRTQAVSAGLRRVFEERDIQVIAPMHGCVLSGREVVNRHYELVQAIISEAKPGAES